MQLDPASEIITRRAVDPDLSTDGFSKSASPGKLLELTVAEERLLSDCETRIERGMRTFFEVGSALMSIKRQRLYRRTHLTFEAYCQDRWRMSRYYAYRLIGAATVAGLLANVDTQAPSSEAQVRPLAGLNPEIIPQVWQEVVARARGQPITGRLVQAVVAERERSGSNPVRSSPRLHRRRLGRANDPRGVLQSLYKAKLMVERGYTEEALRVLDDIEDWLKRCPMRCAQDVSGTGWETSPTLEVCSSFGPMPSTEAASPAF